MDRAALLLLVSGMGFGWQPMPDGAPQYEYIVQIDPDLLATMAQGQTIPIVSEVPSHIGPIARVRIVVGSEEPPRRQLVTAMKPVEDAPAGGAQTGGIALAQYNQPVPTTAAQEASAWNRYDSTGAASGASEWNAAASQAAAAPTTGGEAYSWNDGTATPAMAATPRPLERVGQGLQDAAQPIRNGLDRVDDRMRSAAENLRTGAREALDDLGRPILGARNPAIPTGQPAPTAGPALPAAPGWNGAAVSGPADDGTANNWNNPGGTGATDAPAQPGSRYGAIGSPTTGVGAGQGSGESSWNAGPESDATAGSQYAAPSGQNGGVDPFASAADPRLRSPGGLSQTQNVPPASANPGNPAAGFGDGQAWNGDGPRLPALDGMMAGQSAGTWNGEPSPAPPPLGVPAIGRAMLDQPASRPLEGGNGLVMDNASLGAADFSLGGTKPPSALDKLSATGQGWNDVQTAEPKPTPAKTTPPAAVETPPASSSNTAAVLAAWVLLTGSIAGNLYLFWSYLDVRQKYRSLVRKTSRAVGSRFSAA